MAWIKSILRPDLQISADYWDFISIHYKHREQMSEVIVGGWPTQAHFNSGADPLLTRTYMVPAGQAPELATGALQFCTTYARSQPEFEGSEEVS